MEEQLDVDSVILPISTSELSNFLAVQLITLMNSPVHVQGVKGLTCIGEFGWRLFADIDEEQKQNICDHLSHAGVKVEPHDSPNILTKGKITTGLYMVIRSLMAANIRTVILTGYGMKMPYPEVDFINFLETPRDAPLARYDFGMNIDTGNIPIFELDSGTSGSVYPMLGDLGAGYGSVLMNLHSDDDKITNICVKCYPRIIHYLKSHHLTMDMPSTILGMKKKLDKIIVVMKQMRTTDSCKLYGYRYEYCFTARRRMYTCYQLASQYPLDMDIPVGINLGFELHRKLYVNNLQDTIREMSPVIRHGRSTSSPSAKQMTAFAKVCYVVTNVNLFAICVGFECSWFLLHSLE